MRQFEPLPSGVTQEWMRRLAGKSLDEIIAILGPPSREYGPSEWTGDYNDKTKPSVVIRHSKSLEFAVDGVTVKTVLIHVGDDGQLSYEFRGREITTPKRRLCQVPIVLEKVGEFIPQVGDETILENLAERLPGLAPKEYLVGLFLTRCVWKARQSVTRKTDGNHVSAIETLSVARVVAASVFGGNAKAWLEAIGLTSSARFGEAVYSFANRGMFGIAEHDRIEDFNVHSDFDEYLADNTQSGVADIHSCDLLTIWAADPRVPVRFDKRSKDYRLIINSNERLRMLFCPWCGDSLIQPPEPAVRCEGYCKHLPDLSRKPNSPIKFNDYRQNYEIVGRRFGSVALFYCPICGIKQPVHDDRDRFYERSPDEVAELTERTKNITTIDQAIETLGAPDQQRGRTVDYLYIGGKKTPFGDNKVLFYERLAKTVSRLLNNGHF